MGNRRWWAAIVFVAGVSCVALAAQKISPAETQLAFDPTSAYRERQVWGWRVLVNSRLLDQPEVAKAALAELDRQLYQVERGVPEKALADLKKVTIWLELKNRDVACACYHPSGQWLAGHGFNPEKAKGIEIGHARNFVSWARVQPFMVLHELAHAYHHQVLGYDHPAIQSAYRKAVESKSYESVLYYDGKKARHYGLNNDQEYLAEGTEAFFGTNDFYPFVRPELQQHDPGMYAVLREVWGVSPKAATRAADASDGGEEPIARPTDSQR